MNDRTICNRCKGSGMLEADLRHHATCDYRRHIFGCDDCSGTGFRLIDEGNRVYAGTSYRNEVPYGNPKT